MLTVANGGPHTSHVMIELRDGGIRYPIGASAAKNIVSQRNVSLFWPPTEPGGHTLIVNGAAEGQRLPTGVTMADITLLKSVSHRSGLKPPDSDGLCA